jgi:hypothetical protein
LNKSHNAVPKEELSWFTPFFFLPVKSSSIPLASACANSQRRACVLLMMMAVAVVVMDDSSLSGGGGAPRVCAC